MQLDVSSAPLPVKLRRVGRLHINHNKIYIIFESKQETLTIHKTSLKLRKQNGLRLEFSLLN